MRIWVIISSIIILVFCVPGLLLSLLTSDWESVIVCVLLNALAIHALYYAKIAVTSPQPGYRHLAANQFLLGILCALLLLRLNQTLANPALWDEVYTQLVVIFQQWPDMAASQQEIETALQTAIEPLRRSMAMVIIAIAALVVLSQTLFAWALYRRARPVTP